MASKMTTKDFFASGTPQQYEYVLSQYDKALRLKAESKSQKPENVIKLDKWYQNELPKKIKSRGKDAHLIHDEMVQTIKWKLARGKFRPNLVNLVQMNTPRVVMQETKKAFRKLQKTGDVQSAVNALCNLKGVGPGLASAVLAAGAPHIAPFMADECLLAMPDVDSLDYTMKEYMRFVEYVKACVERLNSSGESWTPHKVELTVWTHYILRDLQPDLLDDMPEAGPAVKATPAAPPKIPDNNSGAPNANGLNDEDTKSSMAESTASSVGDEDSNISEAKNENSNSEEEKISPSSEVPEAEIPENGNNKISPKTNGNNSHSNGSEASNNEQAKEQNGDQAKAASQPQETNGELENGVKSSEKESTDLTTSKRSLEEEVSVESTEAESEPAAKKLKTCEEDSAGVEPEPETAPESNSSNAPNPTPQVAV